MHALHKDVRTERRTHEDTFKYTLYLCNFVYVSVSTRCNSRLLSCIVFAPQGARHSVLTLYNKLNPRRQLQFVRHVKLVELPSPADNILCNFLLTSCYAAALNMKNQFQIPCNIQTAASHAFAVSLQHTHAGGPTQPWPHNITVYCRRTSSTYAQRGVNGQGGKWIRGTWCEQCKGEGGVGETDAVAAGDAPIYMSLVTLWAPSFQVLLAQPRQYLHLSPSSSSSVSPFSLSVSLFLFSLCFAQLSSVFA